ncbi:MULTISPECIES: azurin [unclassified Siphonobacter]|uniref:azurin n=1 Tax=unclassified Siphonobacter TaxID=2635712 RepID=UPI000CA6FCFB|nr:MULTISPECIES: azurin [unclassified Siphonobacter]MDQ1087794.1 azurin [Siphonobacter sp. SORGH_AS_1065]MDR6193941.1 azurin [Siphonobacter sp. SORGH_AS_0500]PKK35174.1 azurin [Siphonobacter sp. SORGH_AS_0500]
MNTKRFRLFAAALALCSVSTFLPATEASAQAGKPAKALVLNANDAMQFDKKEFKVKAGQKVKLTLKHTGKFAKQAMGHNFVLLKPGTDLQAFASKANMASSTEYIPKSESASIVAHTKLLGGGESDTIEFTAPKKGTYTYICSFPGHYGIMQGKFVVE